MAIIPSEKKQAKKKNFFGRNLFLVIVIMVFMVSAVSYAASVITLNDSASITAAANDTSVSVATTEGKYGGTPAWGVAVLSETTELSAGDLYVTNLHSTDKVATLYLDNSKALKEDYSYFKMRISVYKWDSSLNNGAGGWSSTNESSDILDLNNGYVKFLLDAGAKYSISIDSGDYYTIDALSPSAPKFTLKVE